MERIKLSDLVVNEQVEGCLLVRQCKVGTASTGNRYWSLELQDCAGVTISAKYWDAGDQEPLPEGTVIDMKASVDEYRRQLQLKLWSFKVVDDADICDYLPQSKRNVGKMKAELESLIDSVDNPYLSSLLKTGFCDDFKDKFCRAPAAVNNHQASVGGLLEHSLGVARICDVLCGMYPKLNRDLLITGALLHDIGKVQEYGISTSFQQTDTGRFLGHIVLGVRLLDQVLNDLPQFPPELSQELYHLLVSHHGKLEFGSPVEPVSGEAYALHYADAIDAYLAGFQERIQSDLLGSGWAPGGFMFGNRKLRVPQTSENNMF